jgi:hypothetical protein
MKNIHILPTDKPSRLVRIYSDVERNNFTIKLDTKVNDSFKEYVNIYITSDEEIKEGDWFLTDDKRVEKCTPDWRAREWHKKIILTTDFRLAPDVQKIDDEFLEWFVKNPSCEKIEVNSVIILKESRDEIDYHNYKIIIPQEEPKQDLEKEMFELEQQLDIPSSMRWHNSKPKQETLEEVAKQSAVEQFEAGNSAYILGFTEGAKSEAARDAYNASQERSYSEEEVQLIASKLLTDIKNGNAGNSVEWFKQFKKK